MVFDRPNAYKETSHSGTHHKIYYKTTDDVLDKTQHVVFKTMLMTIVYPFYANVNTFSPNLLQLPEFPDNQIRWLLKNCPG